MEACAGTDTSKAEIFSRNGHTADTRRIREENWQYGDRLTLRQEKRKIDICSFAVKRLERHNEKERNNNHIADFPSSVAGNCPYVLYRVRYEEDERARGGAGQETESGYLRASGRHRSESS